MQTKTITTPNSVWRNPIHFLAFGFGSGAAPFAPGTAGTVVGVVFYLLLQPLSITYYLLALIFLFAVGCYLCEVTENDVGIVDHPGIVWDEIVGFLVTMIAVPHNWYWILTGFILFRLFDITKPWPIKAAEKYCRDGVAIMLDDVIAGIAAWLVLQVLVYLLG